MSTIVTPAVRALRKQGIRFELLEYDYDPDADAIGLHAAQARRCELADPKQAERATGYVVGGISPVGQRKSVPTYLDESALHLDAIVINGGRRGLQIELSPGDLVTITGATVLPVQST